MKKILIVDDEPVIVKIMESRLRANKYQVETAAGGEAALQKAQSLKPDLILLDVLMPDMDGYELCRRLKSLPATRQIPIIMFTASQDDGFEHRGLQAGAEAVVNKPFVADLLSAIRRVFDPASEDAA